MSTRAAIRYARAILDQAKERGTEEVVFGNMKSIDATLNASKELRNVLKSPVIKAEDKNKYNFHHYRYIWHPENVFPVIFVPAKLNDNKSE